MAFSNAQPISIKDCRMPSEPCPLPSLGSDEESFVVLGNSLCPDMETPSSSEELFQPIGTSVLEEAKQLINNELSAVEQMSMANKSRMEQSMSANRRQGQESLQTSPLATSLEQSTITLPEMPNVAFETANNAISIATISTELSSEEVQSQISHIIEENLHLKDVLLQNNMSMKSQIERIVAWQEDVQKVHQAHKDKLIEAKEFIERLKKENIAVKLELDNVKLINIKQEKEIASLKTALQDRERKCNEKLLETTTNNMKEFELDVANKKMKELESALKTLTLENTDLKSENSKLVENVRENEICKTQVGDFESAKKEIEELKSTLMKINHEANEKERSLTTIINDLQTRLPHMEEMINTRTQLTNAQIALTQTEQSRAAAYAQVNSMFKQIGDMNQQIAGLTAQVNALHEHNEELKTQSVSKDDLFALQTQLEIYRNDFETEKTTKELLKNEKDKLVEDLQNLQRRNQQLQEEIEMVRENRDYVVYPQRERGSSSARSAASNSPPLRRYVCPICGLQFRSLRLLEDHVDMCVDHRP